MPDDVPIACNSPGNRARADCKSGNCRGHDPDNMIKEARNGLEDSAEYNMPDAAQVPDIAQMRCPSQRCSGAPVVTDNLSGEMFCGSCGFVLLERMTDPSPEHGSDAAMFSTKTRTRPGQSLAVHGMVHATVISDRDATGRSLSGGVKSTFGRLKVLDVRSGTPSSTRTLRSALSFLHSLRMKLGLPDSIADNAAYLYRKAMKKGIIVGRSSRDLMSAAVYLACRQSHIARSLDDISAAANARKKEVSRACRNLIEKLEISLEPCSPSEFVAKVSHEANISEKTRRDALRILSTLHENGTSAGKNPIALATATLYMSCVLNGERKTQAEIAKASGITSVTIRNRYIALKKEIDVNGLAINQ